MTRFNSSGTCIRTFVVDDPAVSTSRLRVVIESIDEDADCVITSVGTSNECDAELEELAELDKVDFSVTFGTGDSFSGEAAAARPAASSKIEVGTGPNAIGSCVFPQNSSRNALLCLHHSSCRPCSHDATCHTGEVLVGARVAQATLPTYCPTC